MPKPLSALNLCKAVLHFVKTSMKCMFTLSNSLSFLRFPLAFLFLVQSSYVRLFAILLAMITDSIDGYIARKRKSVTQFGTILDPLADKFFVYFALISLNYEGILLSWQVFSMISRDISILLFGFLALVLKKPFQVKSFKIGKLFTALQFLALVALVFHVSIPTFVFYSFYILGLMAFFELYFTMTDRSNKL